MSEISLLYGRKQRKNVSNTGMMRNIIPIILPAILEFSFQALVNYSDFIMVGKLGINATAAIGITNEVSFLVKAGVNALGVGVIAYFAKEVGAGRYGGLKKAALQAYIMAIVVGIITTVLPLICSPILPTLLRAKKEIRSTASAYFAITSSAGFFFSFNVIAGSIRKACRDMKTPLIINGFINILNIILNWFLIYPSLEIDFLGFNFAIPRADLGVIGAAIGTATSVVLGGILMVIVNERVDYISVRNIFRNMDLIRNNIDFNILKKFILIGIPAFLTSVVTSFGRVIFTAMIVPLGTVIYASHSIAFTAESAFYIPAVGISNAVAVLSGNVRGEGDLKKLNRQTNYVCVLTAIIMSVATIIMLLCAENIIMIFTKDPEAIKIAARLLRIVAINEPFFGISIVMQYVFSGIGKTKPPLYISSFTQWGIRVLGVFVFVTLLGYGIEAAWLCMIFDNIARAFLLYIWYWISNKKLI